MKPAIIFVIKRLSDGAIWRGDSRHLYDSIYQKNGPCALEFKYIQQWLFQTFSDRDFEIAVDSVQLGRQEAWGDRSWSLTWVDRQKNPELKETYYSIGD